MGCWQVFSHLCWITYLYLVHHDLEEYFTTKNENVIIYLLSGHPNLALLHLLTNGSSAVNGCRQNQSPKLYNNPQVIHTTPVHQ